MWKPSEDLYALLGVAPDATKDDINKIFRKLSPLYHPDRLPWAEKAYGEAKFKKLSAARDILTDPEQRTRYDEQQSDQRRETSQQKAKRMAREVERQEYARAQMRQQAELKKSWKMAEERRKAVEAEREKRAKAAAEATAHYAHQVKSSYVPTDSPPRNPEWKPSSKMSLAEILASTTGGYGAPTVWPATPRPTAPTPQATTPITPNLGRRTPLAASSPAGSSIRGRPTSPFAFGRSRTPYSQTSPFPRVPPGRQYFSSSPMRSARPAQGSTPTSPMPSVAPASKRKRENEIEATGDSKKAKVVDSATA